MKHSLFRLHFSHRPTRLTGACLLCLGILSLSACGDSEAPKAATQVAVKVGSSEISIHQINQALARTPLNSSSKDEVQAARQATLERLIDQQLAVDQATELKLHRSPDVVAKLEAARREVLARAYLEQLSQSVTKASAEEVKQYYDSNPALFAERRIFNLQELRIPRVGESLDQLRTMAEQGRNLDEVAAMLKAQNVGFGAGGGVRNAEQVPMEILPKLHALKDGQNLLVVQGPGATLLRLAASSSSPVTLATATPGIEKFISNRRTTETVSGEIKRLRAATTIQYEGDFAQASATAADVAAPAAENKVSPSASESPGKPDAGQIERGLQGLK
ncbi:EpsD family peptidyl-prolyl cis-trans isomerase [Hydrogenophaga sp.]|uniref:EpsD family peptidyl-prolyl cis-trans isomerase n=1 Tax=Hydrogenophaga sp. TaxID=1904254 RepID=UPI00262C4A59|nr:EpsD family peptidyl-prolyl cis-trans isomerase [Hydrogenophaga sp.]MDM7948596.1 EpsD family peptidyl-prolyl cis-trans isomerase [Hydrogenophaga sp.]